MLTSLPWGGGIKISFINKGATKCTVPWNAIHIKQLLINSLNLDLLFLLNDQCGAQGVWSKLSYIIHSLAYVECNYMQAILG